MSSSDCSRHAPVRQKRMATPAQQNTNPHHARIVKPRSKRPSSQRRWLASPTAMADTHRAVSIAAVSSTTVLHTPVSPFPARHGRNSGQACPSLRNPCASVTWFSSIRKAESFPTSESTSVAGASYTRLRAENTFVSIAWTSATGENTSSPHGESSQASGTSRTQRCRGVC